jgi:ATP-dependent protease ClpP protease subunit
MINKDEFLIITMAKELYLYSGIYDFVAEGLISAMNEVLGKAVTIRVNSPGGRVLAHWGIVAKMKEHGDVTLQVDGGAFSAAANLTLYAKKVKALEVSKFMFHRADGPTDTQADKDFLAGINADLKSRMAAKVDSNKLMNMKGVTVDMLYDPNQRIDLFLSASEMKELGLIDEITSVDPSEINSFNHRSFDIAATLPPITQQENKQTLVMTTLAELKEKFPALYALAITEGEKTGAEKELDRVNSVMVFAHLDPVEAKKIIASGKHLTETQRSEFALKALSPERLKAVGADATPPVITAEAQQVTAEKLELDAFEKGVRAEFKLKV